MKQFILSIVLALIAMTAKAQDSPYKPGPDAQPQAGAAKGKVEGPIVHVDKIYPGISTEYWIYIPADFDALTTAPALMVFQDGWQYLRENGVVRAQNIFDNLIAKHEIPPIVAVFVNPGHSEGEKSPDDNNWNTRHRTIEYDTLGADYSKLLIDEILPEVAAKYKFSDNPDLHAICGASSGGIASFTADWERNHYFRKVVSHIGSFTDLRGGYVYPDKIRAEPKAKAIRIAMQDGLQDNRNPGNLNRDWVVQNRLLFEALCDKGYDVQFTFGTDKHRLDHGGSILPDQLRWLWLDAGGIANGNAPR